MYSDAEIREKQQLASAAGLSGAELLNDAAAVRRDCNGIGAAWMLDATREWISTANPSLVVVADIHDRRYSEGGTEKDRQAADAEFRSNGMKIAKYVYRWYDPRRYWVMWQVRKFSALLAGFGALAFNYREE
ncbi:hypothetical protein [uncultured Victivallis sp.]|uniref:hypothetical protein n=1 Tax=uncultured Victivallis sp. TaxID=354118 RepID=UPI00259234EB|nr:hypothetical protein [uncultured Victivallis sp.]